MSTIEKSQSVHYREVSTYLEECLHVKDVFGELFHELEEHKVVCLPEDQALVQSEDREASAEDKLDPFQQETVHNAQG